MNFELLIRNWYTENKRNLPWRDIKNPYFVWLSEVIMQQTRVAQGTAYFMRFAETFPTVKTLADAPLDDILKLWEGLGYYSRARNLHAGAKQVVDNFGAEIPSTYKELLTIKGIGPYTAAAISSICFHQKHAVVDGNVFRVLSRIYGIETPINSSAGAKQFSILANELIATSPNPGDYNQAVMEFGALHCTPKNPNCATCIFNSNCAAFQTGKVSELPQKIKANKIRNRYFDFLICIDKNKVAIQKRGTKDIWAELYQFPLIESLDVVRPEKATHYNEKPIIHLLSHQRLHINFTRIKARNLPVTEELIWVDLNQLSRYAFPIVIKRFIDANLLHLSPTNS